jgi:hypothetical protein
MSKRKKWDAGCSGTRVTSLGDFSPIGWLFTLGSFFQKLQNYIGKYLAQIYGLLFPNVISYT